MTSAMREYIGSKYFSPDLEKKKYQNIDKFFIVRSNQEKYQIINSIFRDSGSKPTFTTCMKTDEKRVGDSPDRVKEKEKNGDIIDLRIKMIDEAIKKSVDDEVNREMKRNEEDRKIINLKFKKKKKRGLSLSQKFYTLNMKSRHIIDSLSQVTMEKSRRLFVDGSVLQEISARSGMASNRSEAFRKSRGDDEVLKFPAIYKK